MHVFNGQKCESHPGLWAWPQPHWAHIPPWSLRGWKTLMSKKQRSCWKWFLSLTQKYPPVEEAASSLLPMSPLETGREAHFSCVRCLRMGVARRKKLLFQCTHRNHGWLWNRSVWPHVVRRAGCWSADPHRWRLDADHWWCRSSSGRGPPPLSMESVCFSTRVGKKKKKDEELISCWKKWSLIRHESGWVYHHFFLPSIFCELVLANSYNDDAGFSVSAFIFFQI